MSTPMDLGKIENWLSHEIDKLDARTNHTIAVATIEARARLVAKLADVRLARITVGLS